MKMKITDNESHRIVEFHSGSKEFPLEILICHTPNGIRYSVKRAEDTYTGSVELADREDTHGKLTNVQLRAIAAKDQLDTLLEDELFDVIKELAEASDERFEFLMKIACVGSETMESDIESDPEDDSINKAIKAMALFCYTEIVERGLKKPGIQE